MLSIVDESEHNSSRPISDSRRIDLCDRAYFVVITPEENDLDTFGESFDASTWRKSTATIMGNHR